MAAIFAVLLAGCAAVQDTWQNVTGAAVERTFNVPIARVKPAFVSTLSQMGLQISAVETNGKFEVVKARKGDRSVAIQFERLDASSTRVRVSGSDGATADQVMRETEKRLAAG